MEQSTTYSTDRDGNTIYLGDTVVSMLDRHAYVVRGILPDGLVIGPACNDNIHKVNPFDVLLAR